MFGRTEESADVVMPVFGDFIGKLFAFFVGTDAWLIFVNVIKIPALATEFHSVFLKPGICFSSHLLSALLRITYHAITEYPIEIKVNDSWKR